jgi:hypothetical protein
MNRKAHHIRLYKRLNLSDSATIADLKKSYFHLANKYHPDKATRPEPTPINTELFNEVQTAYRELKQFYEQYGHLPLNSGLDSPGHLNRSKPDSHTRRFGTIGRSSYLLFGLLMTLLLILLFLPSPDDRNTTLSEANSSSKSQLKPGGDLTTDAHLHIQHSPSLAELQTQPIRIGLSMGEVFDLLGVPDTTINNQWYYGSSEIYFRDGLVSGWNNDPKSPMWTDDSLPSRVTPQPRLR